MAPSLEPSVTDTTRRTTKAKEVKSLQHEDGDKNGLVLRVFRCLIADLCEQFKGGHPGYVSLALLLCIPLTAFRGAMGMAAIGVALWKYVMRYSPRNPSYFNRDRFVLSNGKFVSAKKDLSG